MKNQELINKYEKALILSTEHEHLKCHTLGLARAIKTLINDDYKPTVLDKIWIDYFLADYSETNN